MSGIIYGLADPRTGQIRYVGKSTNGQGRARCHRGLAQRGERGHKAAWIRSLPDQCYEIVLLDEPSDLDGAERWWIAYGRRNWNLTNTLDGGDGARHTEETRRRIAEANKGHLTTPETRAKIGTANRGRSPSQEARAKMSMAGRGKKKSPAARTKMAQAMRRRGPEFWAKVAERTRNCSAVTRAKLSASTTASWVARRTNRAQLPLFAAASGAVPPTQE